MEGELLIPRALDLIFLSESTSKPHFLGFLTEEEATTVYTAIKGKTENISFFGGYDNAERTLFCAYPEWCSEIKFPIEAVTFSFNGAYKLSHRDFLGALMSIGIKRESVGDILLDEDRAIVFLRIEVLEFVLTQITKVGRVGVKLSRGYEGDLPQKSILKPFSTTVASMRLDCVVSALCNISRGLATDLIEESKVSLNSVFIEKSTKTVEAGDKLSVRGYGKFYITSDSDLTKKGRIILKYNKYV